MYPQTCPKISYFLLPQHYKIIGLLCLFFLFTHVAYAQEVSWVRADNTLGGNFFSIEEAAPGTLFAASGRVGLYESTDGGNSWQKTELPDPNFEDTGYSIIPLGNEEVIYAGWRYNSDVWTQVNLISWGSVWHHDSKLYEFSSGGEIRVSADQGVTWTLFALLPEEPACNWTSNRGPVFLDADTMYVLNRGCNLIYHSSDGGSTWTIIEDDQFQFPQSISIAPNGDLFVVNSSMGFLRSTDQGATWEQPIPALSTTSISSVYYDGTNRILVGSDGDGVWFSEDQGSSWGRLDQEGLADAWVRDILVTGTGDLFVTADAIYRSTDNGSTWLPVEGETLPGQRFNNIYIDPKNRIYADFNGELTRVSQNQGQDWIASPPLVQVSNVVEFGEDVYVGSLGVYRSSDAGDTWSNVLAETIVDLAVSLSGDLYAVSREGVLYNSPDRGVEWISLIEDAQRPIGAVGIGMNDDVFVGFADRAGIYAYDETGGFNFSGFFDNTPIIGFARSSSGSLFAMSDGTVARLKDGETVWEHLTNGLPGDEADLTTIVVNKNGDLFLGSGVGVFMSKDDGDTWAEMSEGFVSNTLGFVSNRINSLAIDNEGHLFAATDVGLFRTNTAVTVDLEQPTATVPSGFNSSAFPNPARTHAQIHIQNPASTSVNVLLYDALGRLVGHLYEGGLGQGSHVLEWNIPNHVGKGLYFYRIQSHEHQQSFPLLIVK